MPRARLLTLTLATLPLAGPAAIPAWAADATPTRAGQAENAIRDFMTGLLGPDMRVGDKPIHLAPNGDHYDASATLAPGQQVTAAVREGAAGIWTFDGLRYPNPAHFTFELPGTVPNAPPTRLTYDIKVAEQNGAGTIDTTLATPSTSSTNLRAMDVTMTSSERSSTSHIGRATGTSTLRPGGGTTVDLLATSALADYSIVATAQMPDTALNMRLDMDTVEGRTEMIGVDRTKGMALVRAAVSVIANDYAAIVNGATFDPSPANALVKGLEGLATSFLLDESATKVRGTFNGFAFSLDRVRFGMDGRAPDGRLGFGLELEADGLVMPAIAGTPMAAFIPSKVQLHPSVTGIDTHDLLAALAIATDPKRPKDAGPPPEFFALLSKPGLAAGLDSLEVDLGPSVLTGAGKVEAPVPGRIAGVGQVTMTNFDALTDRVKTLPQANQALPVLLFAKGIGRTDGARLVWDITYDGAKLLVNGVDVMALGGGGGGGGGSGGGGGTTQPRRR